MVNESSVFKASRFQFIVIIFDFLSKLSTTTLGLSSAKTKVKRKVQGVPQSQTAALPRHLEEEETDKTK